MIDFGLGFLTCFVALGFMHLHYSSKITKLELELETWAKRAYLARAANSSVKAASSTAVPTAKVP